MTLVRILGASLTALLITLPAYSQNLPAHRVRHRIHRPTPSRIRITPRLGEFNPAGSATHNISGVVAYPYGSRVFNDGTVQIPNSQVVAPATTINHGNGSTTYYYPDGSHIDTNGSAIPAFGTPLR